jgi:hypothetical protein
MSSGSHPDTIRLFASDEEANSFLNYRSGSDAHVQQQPADFDAVDICFPAACGDSITQQHDEFDRPSALLITAAAHPTPACT